jgi:protein-tyrosine phosphatase
VFVCEVPNARELGGTPLATGQAVACGALYRGAPLAGLSSDGCAVFGLLGIRTIIDLRMPEERAAVPEAVCVQSAANIVLAPMPIPYNVSPAEYIADLDAKPSLAAAFAALGDPAAYPIYVHCTYGRDRTGVLAAAVLSALGASRATILQEYLISQQSVGAVPGSLTAVLDEIDARGGIDAVLAAAGVTPEQIANLRARAIAP